MSRILLASIVRTGESVLTTPVNDNQLLPADVTIYEKDVRRMALLGLATHRSPT